MMNPIEQTTQWLSEALEQLPLYFAFGAAICLRGIKRHGKRVAKSIAKAYRGAGARTGASMGVRQVDDWPAAVALGEVVRKLVRGFSMATPHTDSQGSGAPESAGAVWATVRPRDRTYLGGVVAMAVLLLVIGVWHVVTSVFALSTDAMSQGFCYLFGAYALVFLVARVNRLEQEDRRSSAVQLVSPVAVALCALGCRAFDPWYQAPFGGIVLWATAFCGVGTAVAAVVASLVRRPQRCRRPLARITRLLIAVVMAMFAVEQAYLAIGIGSIGFVGLEHASLSTVASVCAAAVARGPASQLDSARR